MRKIVYNTSCTHFAGALQNVIHIYEHYDILVNNAGIATHEDFEVLLKINLVGIQLTAWHIFTVNYAYTCMQTAVMNGTYMAVEHMRTDNGGHGGIIVNIGSTAGIYFTS